MPVRYDIYEIPSPEENDENTLLYARILNNDTISTQELARKIHRESSVTEGDIYSVLSGLSYHIAELLSNGNRVHIDGLGYFQLTATSPRFKTRKDFKGNLIKVKSIRFQPEKSFRNEVADQTTFLRMNKQVVHSPKFTDKELEDILKEYFEKHGYITRSAFQELCGYTKTTAIVRLKKLSAEGKLKKCGTAKFPIYEPGAFENE